jgi:tRNA nucleotidyltransferase (CCA-adding enzyme)
LELVDEESRSVLSRLSGERMRHEFDLIFEEDDPSAMLTRLAEMYLFRPVHAALATISSRLPELSEPPSEWGEFKTGDILTLRQALGWVCWLAPLGLNEIDWIADRLAFPAALIKAARAAASLVDEFPSLTDASPSRLTLRLDEFPELAVYAVYLLTQESTIKEYLVNWRRIRPRTTGDDLKARGLPPGPEYKRILGRLRAARLDGEVITNEQEMILLDQLLKKEV